MALGRMASCRAAVPASSPLGEALVKQSLRTQTQKPVAVKHQMMTPGSRACRCWQLNLVQETQLMCLESVQKKSFFAFAFSQVLCFYFMHKGSNHIPKSNCLVQLLFFFPVFCLIEVCGGKDFKMHTRTQYRWGSAQVGAGRAEEILVCSSFYYQPLGHAPLCSSNHCQ